MPRTFNDSLEEDIDNVFLNTNEFAVSVTIRRGIYSTLNVPALVSQSDSDVSEEESVGEEIEEREYRIRASKYVINGAVTLPQDKDRLIQVLRSGVTITCEVLPIGNQPCCDIDANGVMLLVRTKRVG